MDKVKEMWSKLKPWQQVAVGVLVGMTLMAIILNI